MVRAEIVQRLTVIGAQNPEEAKQYLEHKDPCFGTYDKNDETCGRCRCPVLLDNKVFLLYEVCSALSKNKDPVNGIKAIRSKEVQARLASGESFLDIIRFMVGEVPTIDNIKEAYAILINRFKYLHKKNIPTPEILTIEETISGLT